MEQPPPYDVINTMSFSGQEVTGFLPCAHLYGNILQI
jgi:hypothetical protein